MEKEISFFAACVWCVLFSSSLAQSASRAIFRSIIIFFSFLPGSLSRFGKKMAYIAFNGIWALVNVLKNIFFAVLFCTV